MVDINAIINRERLLLRPIYKQIAKLQNTEKISASTFMVIFGTKLLTARVHQIQAILGYALSCLVNWLDRKTCILFGNVVGDVLVQTCESDEADLLGFELISNGGTDGSPLDAPPLIKATAKDCRLSRYKIIYEPWDCGGLYLVGKFPNWDNVNNWKPCHGIKFLRESKGICYYQFLRESKGILETLRKRAHMITDGFNSCKNVVCNFTAGIQAWMQLMFHGDTTTYQWLIALQVSSAEDVKWATTNALSGGKTMKQVRLYHWWLPWQASTTEVETWEAVTLLKGQFLEVCLEGKTCFEGGSNDTDHD